MVISEEPANIWKRTHEKIHNNYRYDRFHVEDKFYIINFYEIDEETYRIVKRHNPTNQGFIQLSEDDAFDMLIYGDH